MLPEFKNLKEMMQRFSDDAICREYLEQQRWNGTPVCPHCGCQGGYKLANGKTYKCKQKECAKKYTVTVGTVFEASNIPLNVWFYAVYVATAHKKGISSLQLSRDLGITQKSAWFMLYRIREAFRVNAPALLEEMVEVDETYVGGKLSNKHKKVRLANRHGEEGRGAVDNKVGVMAFVQRGSTVRTCVIKGDKSLKQMVRDNVATTAMVVTDGLKAYKGMKSEFAGHEVVNHKADEYVRGIFHTNTVEGFFSQLKRGIYGIYHQVNPKHLEKYCLEFAYRYNTREVKDNVRFTLSLQNVQGRLRYQDLIKK